MCSFILWSDPPVAELRFRRIRAVLIKECKQVIYDPIILALSILIPCLQIIIFSFAINTNPKHLPAYVLDFDRTAASSGLIEDMRGTDYFSWQKAPHSYAQALKDLASEKVKFIFIIPPSFHPNTHPMHVIADASDGISASGALGALNGLWLSEQSSAWTFHVKYNPKAITRYTVVPGLIGVILLFSLAMLTSVSIVRERERGTMEMVLSTPLQPLELMLGKILPYLLMGYLQITIILLLSIGPLSIPCRGSVVLLYALSFPYIIANIGMGLLISSLARTEMQASMGISFFMLPSILLSGFMFPIAGMPHWAQSLSFLLPLRHYVVICRGIMLKGLGAADLLSSLWPMVAFFILVITLAVLRFKTTLD